MRKIMAACLALVLVCASAFAQSEFDKPHKSGYFFVAPGALSVNQVSQSSVQIGGGFEGYIYKGFGLWIEGGGIRVASQRSSRSWTGIVSMGGLYNFQRRAEQRVCPFISAGLTAIPEFDSAGAGASFGGGVNYWFARRIGLKTEFRFTTRPGNLRTYNDVHGRIGIAFR